MTKHLRTFPVVFACLRCTAGRHHVGFQTMPCGEPSSISLHVILCLILNSVISLKRKVYLRFWLWKKTTGCLGSKLLGCKHRKIIKFVDLISPRFEKETPEGKPKSNTKLCISLTLPSPISKVLLNSELSVIRDMPSSASRNSLIFI